MRCACIFRSPMKFGDAKLWQPLLYKSQSRFCASTTHTHTYTRRRPVLACRVLLLLVRTGRVRVCSIHRLVVLICHLLSYNDDWCRDPRARACVCMSQSNEIPQRHKLGNQHKWRTPKNLSGQFFVIVFFPLPCSACSISVLRIALFNGLSIVITVGRRAARKYEFLMWFRCYAMSYDDDDDVAVPQVKHNKFINEMRRNIVTFTFNVECFSSDSVFFGEFQCLSLCLLPAQCSLNQSQVDRNMFTFKQCALPSCDLFSANIQ